MMVGHGDEAAFGRNAVQVSFRYLVTNADVLQDVLGKIRCLIFRKLGLGGIDFVNFQDFHDKPGDSFSEPSFQAQHALKFVCT